MKGIYLYAVTLMFLFAPVIASAQKDTATHKAAKDTIPKAVVDTTHKPVADSTYHAVIDTAAAKPKVDTTVMTTPTNCYKQWFDYFSERGAKTVPDGTHEVVIAFKSGESCHCFMGKVEVAGGKIKPPLHVQTEGGDYKTFTSLGKKLDPEFVLAQGSEMYNITNGMSVLFRTADQEYGRIFFYKFLNKDKQMNKEAPSPADLLKN